MTIVVPSGVPKSVLAQKCGNATNTQQAGQSERNENGDLLGFNTGPVNSEKTRWCVSQFDLQLTRRENLISKFKVEHGGIALDSSKCMAR